MVEYGAFTHKIDYVTIFKEIINLEGHPNCITGSKVTVILLNGWLFLIGGASALKGLRLQPPQQACFFLHFDIFQLASGFAYIYCDAVTGNLFLLALNISNIS